MLITGHWKPRWMFWLGLTLLLFQVSVHAAPEITERIEWKKRPIRLELTVGQERRVEFSLMAIMILALVVGVIGGIYGIGGGAIIAPFCVAFLHIPVHTVAGAAMFGTFVTSILGVIIYSTIPFYNGQPAPPDWFLGILFGIGGLLGMYLGATCQKYVPERIIQAILALVIFGVSGNYILQFFM